MISESALSHLEFPKLLAIISDFAHSEASTDAVLRIRPLERVDEIRKRFGEIHEIRRMSQEGRPLGISGFSDIAPLLVKIRPEGSVLDPLELAGFIPLLEIAHGLSLQIRERDDLPCLNSIAGGLTGFPEILKVLKRSVDSEGHILDTASSLLFDLREQIRRLETRIRKRLEEIIRDGNVAVFLQDTFITTRSGRWVIPVRMDSKGQVPGVVHDISKSGETAFIEPLAILQLSNELENLIAEQKAEEIRILKQICSMIRAVSDALSEEFRIIVYIDVLLAVSRCADLIGMEIPQITPGGSIQLMGARHPLLVLAFRAGKGRDVVPLDLSLGRDAMVMVITGANAGGKTIAIKTVGLLLLMALSGIPVPADSASSFPHVDNLLIDIGDEQSIETNLSTFSAHISNLAGILRDAGSNSVALIDELGTGTDPEEGAALSCSILNALHRKGCLVFATTHLADVKAFVYRSEGMMNASMEFDEKTLKPLYRLRAGEPGRSHALEIAKHYGLPEEIIANARELLGGLKNEFDQLLTDLNLKRAEHEKGLRDVHNLREEMQEKNRILEKLLAEAKTGQKEIMTRTYQEASEIISATKRQMNLLMDELKKQEREKRREVLKKADEMQKEAMQKLREYEVHEDVAPSLEEIKTGDVVFIASLGFDATVLEIHEKQQRLRVATGTKEIEVPVADIRIRKGKTLHTGTAFRDMAPEEITPSSINLIGLRVDEAISQLEPFLNHASLAGLPGVTIIHGLGKGLLMRAVHEHLTRHPLIRKFRKGTQPEGGSGVTIATMA